MKRSGFSKPGKPLERKAPMARGTSTLRATKPIEAKPPKGPRPKKCGNRACRAPYVPDPKQLFKKWCSQECCEVLIQEKITKQRTARESAERAKRKKETAETKAKMEAMQPPKWWLARAKKRFHEYVRCRDEGKPCASCDTILRVLGRPGGDYDAGHFRSVGSSKHLEFDERNVFGQCKHCNDHMKGNPQEYERRLRILKGDAFVDELLADQAPRHFKIDDFQRIYDHYSALLKELRKSRA